MLTVLHVDSGREWRGGQAQVLSLIASLRDSPNAHQILAAPPESPLIQRAQQAGIEVHPIPLRGEWDLSSATALRKLAVAQSVSIIHAHDAHAHSIALRAVKRLPHTRLVVHRRVDFPIRHGLFSRLKYGARVDHYIAISEGVARVLTGCGVPRAKITVIHSGIDPAKFDSNTPAPSIRQQFNIDRHQPLIGTVGALVDHKGHKYLLEAMHTILAKFPQARCVIVGEGELRSAFEFTIRDRLIGGKVFLAGWRDDIANCLDDMTVFCLPSHMEGLCTSLLDATLRRKPLVATNTGGVPEIVKDGETGWLVPPRDHPALAQALIDALAHPDEAKRRAENAHRQTLELFTVRAMAEKTLALYHRLADPQQHGHA